MISKQKESPNTLQSYLDDPANHKFSGKNSLQTSSSSTIDELLDKQHDLESIQHHSIHQQPLLPKQEKVNIEAAPKQSIIIKTPKGQSVSEAIQRIRPMIKVKIGEILNRKSRQLERSNNHPKECSQQPSLYHPVMQVNKPNKKQNDFQPQKRCRSVTFNQIIAVKKFISGESPSSMRELVEYHQGLNIKQKNEVDDANDQPNESPSKLKRKIKIRMKVSKKNRTKQQ